MLQKHMPHGKEESTMEPTRIHQVLQDCISTTFELDNVDIPSQNTYGMQHTQLDALFMLLADIQFLVETCSSCL